MSYRVLLASTAACIAVVVPAGCGAPAPPPADSTVTPAPTTSVPASEVIVYGRVQRGVELNCLVFKTTDREYLLVRPPPALQPGVVAHLRGRPEPGMVTTCMQGTPIVVLDARVEGS